MGIFHVGHFGGTWVPWNRIPRSDASQMFMQLKLNQKYRDIRRKTGLRYVQHFMRIHLYPLFIVDISMDTNRE